MLKINNNWDNYQPVNHFGDNSRVLGILIFLGLIMLGCQEPQSNITEQPLTPPALNPTPLIGLEITVRPTMTSEAAIVQKTASPTVAAEPAPPYRAYIIESGDTLVDVAAQFNTTVGEIEAINPGLNPELLEIGKELVIPAATAPADENMADPEQIYTTGLSIQGAALYEAPFDSYWVLGFVQNDTNQPLSAVKLDITIFDSTGNILTGTEVLAQPGTIFPGELGAFAAQFNNIKLAPTNFEARINVAWIGGSPSTSNEGLEIQNPDVAIDGRKVTYSGVIINLGDESYKQLTLLAIFLDSAGLISGYQLLEVDFLLAPGEGYPIKSQSVVLGNQPVKTEFVVHGTIGGD